jgi:GNAT superfamily N-acetyltransferase
VVRILAACIADARVTGFARLALWTHESHAAACARYAKPGFSRVCSKPVTSFGVELVEQQWCLHLTA